MNIKHLAGAGLSLTLIFTVSHTGLGGPTPTPVPSKVHVSAKKAAEMPGVHSTKQPVHVSAKNAAEMSGVHSTKQSVHVSAKNAAEMPGVHSTKQSVHVSAKNAAEIPGIHPTKTQIHLPKNVAEIPGIHSGGTGGGGSGSGGGGSGPGGGGAYPGGGGGHGTLVIVPIVLPYPNAVVQTEPGQIVLPAGSVIPESVAQLEAETRTGGARGCYALTVSTLWNGSFSPASKVNMAVEARNCRPNHRYGIALFSSDSDAAKSPTKIGALQTDQDGYGFQSVVYSPNKLALNYTVGLYELDGDNMIAGPMTQAWAGKIGSPGTL
jgi:hypothetical protein